MNEQEKNSRGGPNSRFDIAEICKIVPHRFPFLLVDKIEELIPGQSVVAIKNVTFNEPFFQGHFPNQPVMPGVLVVESMAQAGAFLVLHTVEKPETKLMYLSAIENARFRKAVVPGDQVRMELKLLKFKLGSCKIEGKAYVNGLLVAEATFIATIGDREV